MKEKLKLYEGYFIILILSLISLLFLPFIGTTVGLVFTFPTTAAGWIVWVVSKMAVILINMILFSQFVRQAKINVKDHPNFIAAQNIFNELENGEEEELLAPNQYFRRLYRNKGTMTLITSMLSVVAFSNAILSFNMISFLTYLFTIVTGIIFGWITMINVEDYWTETYYKLALKIQKKETSNDNSQEKQ